MDGLSDELRTHITSIRRYAMALTGEPTEADDLVQESLTRALAYSRKGGRVKNVRAFLFTVLHNVWASGMQRANRAGPHVPIDAVADQLQTSGNQQSRAELKSLMRALQEVASEQRQVLLLVCLEGFSYRETAAILDIPIGTVMSRLARARKAVVDKMTDERATPLRRVK